MKRNVHQDRTRTNSFCVRFFRLSTGENKRNSSRFTFSFVSSKSRKKTSEEKRNENKRRRIYKNHYNRTVFEDESRLYFDVGLLTRSTIIHFMSFVRTFMSKRYLTRWAKVVVRRRIQRDFICWFRLIFVRRTRRTIVGHVLFQRINTAEFNVTKRTSEFLLQADWIQQIFAWIHIHRFDENLTCEIHGIR